MTYLHTIYELFAYSFDWEKLDIGATLKKSIDFNMFLIDSMWHVFSNLDKQESSRKQGSKHFDGKDRPPHGDFV